MLRSNVCGWHLVDVVSRRVVPSERRVTESHKGWTTTTGSPWQSLQSEPTPVGRLPIFFPNTNRINSGCGCTAVTERVLELPCVVHVYLTGNRLIGRR